MSNFIHNFTFLEILKKVYSFILLFSFISFFFLIFLVKFHIIFSIFFFIMYDIIFLFLIFHINFYITSFIFDYFKENKNKSLFLIMIISLSNFYIFIKYLFFDFFFYNLIF